MASTSSTPVSQEAKRAAADEEILDRVKAGNPDDPLSALTDDDLASLSESERNTLAKWYLQSTPLNESWLGVERGGDPRRFLLGWGLDAWSGHADLDTLRYEVLYWDEDGDHFPTQVPCPREMSIARLAPRRTDATQRAREARENSKVLGRRSLKVERAKDKAERDRSTFLNLIASGYSIDDAKQAMDLKDVRYRQWRHRYPDWARRVTVARKDARIEARATRPSNDQDFVAWRRYYTGYQSYAHHRAIIEAIESCPPGQMTMILVPPEAGKTTLLEDYITWQICREPNHRTLIVSEASSHAEKILSAIKERMTAPDDVDLLTAETPQPSRFREMVAVYGPFHDPVEDRDKQWAASRIKVSKAVGHRDPTIQAVGWNAKVYGARCNDLLLDDMQSVASINLTDQMLMRLQRTFFSRPRQDGRIIYLGTRVGLGDLPEKLVELGIVNKIVVIPAVDDDGQSYCPEMWPVSALLGELDPVSGNRIGGKMQLVGRDGWWCTYMQQPQRAEDGVFREEELGLCEVRDVNLWDRPKFTETASWTIGMSVDPALGGGAAFFTGAYSATKIHMMNAEVHYGLTRNEDIFAIIEAGMARCRGSFLVVERNSMQKGLARDQRLRDMSQSMGFEIIEHETGANKWDPAFGVKAMVPMITMQDLIIPGAPGAREALEPWYKQMIAWRANIPTKLLRQDAVMAFWFFWMHWRKQVQELDIDLDQWTVPGLPWAPGDMSGRFGGNQGRGQQGMGYLAKRAG